MKTLGICIIILCFFSLSLTAQQNHILKGKVLFLSSGKKPAVGVKVSGNIKGVGSANTTYTVYDGSYQLIFPETAIGKPVDLAVGNTDSEGQGIELVNETEIRKFRIPAIATEEFEIIVAIKGERDFVAQRYYNIIKTSAERELDKIKTRLKNMLAQKEENHQIINTLSARIVRLQQQTDSIALYREAFRLASINKDKASERVLKYLKFLDEGKSVQEAREVLSIEGAANDLEEGILQFREAIRELETRAKASESLFDYKDVVYCYNSIIGYLEKMEIDRLEIADYYFKAAVANLRYGRYKTALDYQQKALEIWKVILGPKHPDLAASYDNIGWAYRGLGNYKKALEYARKAIDIREEILDPKHVDLATAYNNIVLIYQALGRYGKALKYHHKSITILEEISNPKHSYLATAYHTIARTYYAMGWYKKALEYQQKAIDIRESILITTHPNLGISYMHMGITYAATKDFRRAINFLEKSLIVFRESLYEDHPNYKKALGNIGLAYARNNQFKEAYTVFTKYEKRFPKDNITYRNWGIYYALKGEKEKALSMLRKAVELGYNDIKWLKTDDSMESLRNEKAFDKLLKKLKKEQYK